MKGRNKGHLTRSAAPLAIGLAMLSAPAMAQDAPVAGVSQDASPAPAPQEIIVTGSRIPQPNLESVSPITVVDAQEIKASGTTRVEDLLNNLPQVFAGQTSGVSNGADGTATVDLRDLGPSRTLVLVNGRRLLPGDPGSPGIGSSPASGSAADLNAIPAALIKRVDVVTGGASATYGADAVAGVVNFILDTDFTGLRVDGQYSFYQHGNRSSVTPPLLDARAAAGFSGYGYPDSSVTDGGSVDATVTFGAGFDDNRGHVTGYFGYRKVDPVLQSNRDYSACTIQNANATTLQCGGSLTSFPGTGIVYNGTTSTVYQPGPGRTLDNTFTRYNFAPTNYFQRPDERYTGGFFAHYDISDAVKPYAEFMFMDDRSVAQIAPSGDFGNTLTINCDNPMLSTQALGVVCSTPNLITDFLGNYPLAHQVDPNQANMPVEFTDPITGAKYNKGFFQLLRRNVEGGPRQADLQHTEYRGVVGVKGDLGPAWSYDAYYQYGRTIYAQTYLNEFSVARLNRALDVVGDPNDPSTWQCRTARSGEDPACVPYDIFGNGTVTPAALNYLSATGFQRGISSEQVASASITGQLGQYGIQLPWADRGVSIALGTEYRREAVELNVDQEFATGDLTGQGGATLPIKGAYYVVEGFGEVEVPIMHDSIFYDLSANAGYRYSSYHVDNGNKFNTDTYKFGVEFAPIRDVRFRASYNRAVRAPNLQELFASQHVALDGSTDPCAGFVITAADTGCLAQGLRVGQTVAPNPAAQYNGLIGGTSTLTPEKADTYSFGVVLQPRWVPGFSLSVDYFNIKLDNAIQGFGADAILASCTANADPTVCGLIHRNPVNGSLWLDPSGYVEDLAQNIGGIKTKGIDFNGSYTRRFDGIGTFSLNMVGTYLNDFIVDNGLSEPYDCAGFYGVTCGVPAPKWRHKLRLNYTSPQGIGLSLAWRYTGPVDVDYSSSSPSLAASFFDFGSHIGGQSYFDLATNYTLGEHYTFRLGVKNIFDKQPPLVTSGSSSGSSSACPTGFCNGNTYPGVYDALGRYIYAGITLDF